MANGQKQARKENGKNGNNANNGKIIPIDSKEKSGSLKMKPLPPPMIDTQKDFEKELNALDTKPLSELVDAAIYSLKKEVRKKAIHLVAELKDVGALKTILYQSIYPDTEATVKSLIDSLANPKQLLPDSETS